MGIIVNKEDNDNELERRITTDLRARAAEDFGDGEVTNFADDAEYVRDTAKTGRFAWVWIVLIVLAIISLVIILTPASRG